MLCGPVSRYTILMLCSASTPSRRVTAGRAFRFSEPDRRPWTVRLEDYRAPPSRADHGPRSLRPSSSISSFEPAAAMCATASEAAAALGSEEESAAKHAAADSGEDQIDASDVTRATIAAQVVSENDSLRSELHRAKRECAGLEELVAEQSRELDALRALVTASSTMAAVRPLLISDLGKVRAASRADREEAMAVARYEQKDMKRSRSASSRLRRGDHHWAPHENGKAAHRAVRGGTAALSTSQPMPLAQLAAEAAENGEIRSLRAMLHRQCSELARCRHLLRIHRIALPRPTCDSRRGDVPSAASLEPPNGKVAATASSDTLINDCSPLARSPPPGAAVHVGSSTPNAREADGEALLRPFAHGHSPPHGLPRCEGQPVTGGLLPERWHARLTPEQRSVAESARGPRSAPDTALNVL